MVRVLHVIKTLQLGGAETNLANLIEVADAEAVDTHVAYALGGPLEARLAGRPLRLYKYSTLDCKVKSVESILIVLRLASYIARHHIQIVHTHNYSAHVWGSVAARLLGAKVVEHVHDPRYEDPDDLKRWGANPVQFAQARLFAKLSTMIVVLTSKNRERLKKLGITEQRIRVINNGIRCSQPPSLDPIGLKNRLGLHPADQVVLAVGRLSSEKNFGFVVDVAEAVRKQSNGTVFLIAGDGAERSKLHDQIRARRLEQVVRLIGYYPEIRELLAISNVLLQPSLRELQSLVMLEAMSEGVPVVVSKGIGCNDEFIAHGRSGFLLDPSDPRPWAETIDRLLADPELSRRVGANGRAVVAERCNLKHTSRQFEALYQKLIANRCA